MRYFKNTVHGLAVVAHECDLSTWEAEAGGGGFVINLVNVGKKGQF